MAGASHSSIPRAAAAAPDGARTRSSGEGRVPLTLITGFLGSGKTTLVNAVLRNPAFAGTLVIVNEFGEVGLDHLLVGSAQDQVVLLDSGCLCCAASGSLRDTLIDLFARRAGAAVEPFDRIFVETSGLAHPGPLVATIIGDSAIRPRCGLSQVLTLVDAENGMATLAEYSEARHQVAFADQLVITKTDKVAEQQVLRMADLLRDLNPHVPIRQWHPGVPPESLFHDAGAPGSSLLGRPDAWLDNLLHARRMRDGKGGAARGAGGSGPLFEAGPGAGLRQSTHGAAYQRLRTHTLHVGTHRLSWAAYAAWTQALMAQLGRRLLRCKGVLRMEDGQAWVIQGVQGYFAPPSRLPVGTQWSGDAFLVCIVDDVAAGDLAAIAAGIPGLPAFSSSSTSDDHHG